MNLPLQLGRIDNAPELEDYQTQPGQMPAAARGKVGLLRLGFSMRQGRSI
ncbi:MAG: hypothetical protein AB7E55_02460 [Pigmentiphaga sp.]